MNADLVLIDSTAWIEFSKKKPGESEIGDEVRRLIESDSACVTQPVIAEVVRGVKTESEDRLFKELFSMIPLRSMNDEVWSATYGHGRKLLEKGFNVKLADQMIASVAVVHGLRLFHRDSDYVNIAEVLDLDEYNFLSE
ncbi:MAG: PIN domain-containing protein [Actinobacteria bacterium]|nr:PIN domain-containing protein [Actinomycetota bacterium]MCG2818976.1 PIN domain-containing protein [Actinomycetes bacterium]MBU4217816.1 PIN domain-containing protein [Actinomycetota bacterium]MBU4359346.1 PIN domain-containing protein [Actinomycetota bacterium]MBU4392448.1 PIN domain-containing protein [Actinomycetota bacterium]